MTIIMSFLSFFILKKTSRTHLIVSKVILIGLFGFSVLSMMFLRNINVKFDNSPAISSESIIVAKYIRGSGKSYSYLLYVGDRMMNIDDTTKILVTSGDYYMAKTGRKICVKRKPGFLGYEFISEVSLGACKNKHWDN